MFSSRGGPQPGTHRLRRQPLRSAPRWVLGAAAAVDLRRPRRTLPRRGRLRRRVVDPAAAGGVQRAL